MQGPCTVMFGRLLTAYCLSLAGLVALAGCSGSGGKVTGFVTFDNKPVDRADVVFELLDDQDERYFGASNEAGEYLLDYRAKAGMPVGRYRALVTRYTLPGGKPLPPGEQGAVMKHTDEAVRQSYSFEVDINAGANKADFELTRGKKTS
ncbi:MAG: hypothetical protein EXR98_03470 [Gemmataceae bacterium]|nr:hypothetical protein [Gemmataceae bacterium]